MRLESAGEIFPKRLSFVWRSASAGVVRSLQAISFMQFIKKRNLQHQMLVTEGGYTWMNARLSLTEALQLYFK